MTETKSVGEETPTRKTARKPVPNRQRGSPVEVSRVTKSTSANTIEATEADSDGEAVISIHSDSDDKSFPEFASQVRKVGGSRHTPVKPKRRDAKGKSRAIVRSEDDQSEPDIEVAQAKKKSSGTRGKSTSQNVLQEELEGEDEEFPSISELAASTVQVKGPAVTHVDKKISVRGTKRKTEIQEHAEGDHDSGVEEISVKPKDNKSAKRTKTTGSPDKPSMKGHNNDRKPEVKREKTPSPTPAGGNVEDGDGLPIVKGFGSDDENNREQDEEEDVVEVPVIRGRQSPVTPEPAVAAPVVPTVPDPTLIEELMDPLLRDTYNNLPHLQRLGLLEPSYGRYSDGGQVMFSGWRSIVKCYLHPGCQTALEGKQCKHMDEIMQYIKMAIVFDRKDTARDRFINLSRISPDILLASTAKGATLHVKPLISRPALCTSVILVRESHLTSYIQHGDYVQKYISGIFHTIEWERFAAVVCEAYNRPDGMKTRLQGSVIQFTSRSVKVSDLDGGNDEPLPAQDIPGLFSPKKSGRTEKASKSSSSSKAPGTLKPVLEPTDFIPVYDARLEILDRPLDFKKLIGDIPSLNLPLYRKEIRPLSAALVVYTVGQWYGGTGPVKYPNLSLNVQWVVLLSSPPM
ncbi:hypothetical protein GLOTRDRAFT_133848 [Gloeophyllum trabeum ATCC 11539]|uniref:Uncharacterized protein n=1 Tax=Gloeophyllum trabeum (strain ATCC 11539 / FP-39264 / Madison 617) TaxID=670483 RepID=S7RDH2_GLOTA|nr:uncharacterized protein GLOTRDRAFT_133848 [Gloeophyllum trabeum ATCC 11539]EPQ50469.1 hypothetical protein GLOTRDRAFT_133848 [Gloeophyllum trabeum ATCC 11539]